MPVTGLLTTHVLDTAHGTPAAGVGISLSRVPGGEVLATTSTNADGRTDEPLLEGPAFAVGTYELAFEVGPYFAARLPSDEPPFLSTVTVRFTVARPGEHYHVPLLVSPWGYTTYRGS